MKGPSGNSVGGVYSNTRLTHSIACLVGTVVHVQVKNGDIFEGVFRTFSPKFDIVLDMVVNMGKKLSTMASVLSSRFDPQLVCKTMIFTASDIVELGAVNVDVEFATRGAETFTDTAISRFNGQVQDRVLEPWDGGVASSDSLTDLGADEISNGWAPDEMFQTNAVKFGVKSSFSSDLNDYTIPLNKQDTDEYKQQEAKANKIAQEIENSLQYKNRAALENGDEEDKFSAVVRQTETNSSSSGATTNNNRFVTHRNRKPPGPRPARSSPSPNAHPQSRMSHPQNYHKSSVQHNQAILPAKTAPSRPVGISPPLPKPSPMHSLPPRHGSSSQVPSVSNAPRSSPSPVSSSSSPLTVPAKNDDMKINGEASSKETGNKDLKTEACQLPKSTDRPKENQEKKKSYLEERTDELKLFHAKFKLEPQTTSSTKNSNLCIEGESVQLSNKEAKDVSSNDDNQESTNSRKGSTLNPNAKEFVLNPNAKSFTPRGLSTPTMGPPPPPPPAVQPPPRLHAQSPVIALPQAHLMPPMPPAAMYNVAAPHYVLPATPVSVPIAAPYTPATSMAQAPRYRKVVPVTLPRNDSSQSIHVQAATGQPILAPPTLSTSQFAIQYTPSPGILHTGGPPQPPLAYTQMYSMVGQRVLTPQPLGMVTAAAAYGDNPHVPTQIYMNPQAVANVAHGGPSSSNQHSNPSTPQSQTPNLHTAPSPVQQAPPQGHGQAPTPSQSSNPSTAQVVYHSQLAAQHPLHLNAASSNHNHPYSMYGAGPQPIMLLPQHSIPGPHHPAAFSTLQNHFHAQTSGAHGTTQQIIPHPPVAMMQTSTVAHAQVNVGNNHHYVPHSQGAHTRLL